MNSKELLKDENLQKVIGNIVNEIEEWLVIYDKEGKVQYINAYAENISGYTREEALNKECNMLWNSNGYNNIMYPQVNLATKNGERFDAVVTNTTKEGALFYLSVYVRAIRDEEGEILYYVTTGKDITGIKELEEKVHKINYYDEVTGLPNQNNFLQYVYKQATKQKEFAIILIDVSQMSYINNTYGLDAGDIVLRELGYRINSVLQTTGMVAKLNADIFGILLSDINDEEEGTQLLEKIFKQVEKPVELEKGQLYVGIKAGAALYPQNADSAGGIINKAQIALTKAKTRPKLKLYKFYSEAIQKEVQARMLLESDMHKAIENKEFIVYYQPFVNLETEEIKGLEALLRRKKSDGQIVAPGKFISLLEEMQLIEQVGIDVIEKVCKQMREWIDKGYKIVPISINLSTIQFENTCLAKAIYDVTCAYDIDPHLITLEITETVIMEDTDSAQETLKQLKAYGFSISIDDFGTGYSSLSYLKKFICDHLKIDISFIKEIAKNPQDRAIVGAIISIAKALSLTTIAEGIETQDQFKLVQEMGCEMGQGYLWDAPMDAEKLSEKYLLQNTELEMKLL